MKQTYTSAATSINSTKLPQIFTAVNLPDLVVLDYGCGRYTHHIRHHIEIQHSTYLPYDLQQHGFKARNWNGYILITA